MDNRQPLSVTAWSLTAILLAFLVAAALMVSSLRRPERTSEVQPPPSSGVSDQLKAAPVQVRPAEP